MSDNIIRLATETEGVRRARAELERQLRLAANDAGRGEPLDEPVAAARRAVEDAERVLLPEDAFRSVPERVVGEREERLAMAARLLSYQHTFLDDCFRAILPHDLIILGARSGAGKSELALMIGMANAMLGKRIHYFALEAEPREIERRSKYRAIVQLALRGRRDLRDLNFVDWYIGRCESLVGDLEDVAERLLKQFATMRTYYRGSSFGYADLRRLLLAIKDETDMAVVDHLHYVDLDADGAANENRAFHDLVKMIRDVSLGIGKPIIVIVHLRKRDRNDRSLVPDMEQVHGSSDIYKIATKQIMFAPATRGLPDGPVTGNTYFSVAKDRVGGEHGLIALCQYDRRLRCYSEHYTLGRQVGDRFEPLDTVDVPRWAKRHQPIFHTPTGAP